MKKLLSLLVIFTLIIGVIPLTRIAGATSQPTSIELSLSGGPVVRVGDTVDVFINVYNPEATQGLVALQGTLNYPEDKVSFESASLGDVFGEQNYSQVSDNTTGAVSMVASKLAGGYNNGEFINLVPFQGSGTAYKITFRVNSPGQITFAMAPNSLILADNQGNAIPFNDPSAATIFALDIPAPPTNLTGTPSQNSIIWHWVDNSDNEEGFRLIDESGQIVATVGPNVYSYTETNLAMNTSYTRYIEAFNAVGRSVSLTTTVATLDETLVAPSNFRGIANSSSQITWTWNDTTQTEDGFKIYDAQNNLIATVNANTTSYIETGLNAATGYTRYIKAYRGSEFSSASQATATTLAATPTTTGGGGGGGGGVITPAPIPNTTPIVTPILVTDKKYEANINATTGGRIEVENKTVVIELPANAVNTDVKITIEKADKNTIPIKAQPEANGLKLGSPIYEFTSSGGSVFAKPISITIKYNPEQVNPDKAKVFWLNENKEVWENIGGTVDKTNHTITFTTSHFSKYAVMEAPEGFMDIANHWAKKDIEEMVTKGIVKGITETQFAPEANITRAEFATLLVRALGLKENLANNNFKDVLPSQWFYRTVLTAYNHGLIKGNDGLFRPNDKITREEIAVILTRVLEKRGTKTQKINTTTYLAKFKDKAEISSWAKDSLAQAVAQGLVNGKNGNKIAPRANATRAEGVVLIKRTVNKIKK